MWRSVTNIIRRDKPQHRNIGIAPRDRQAPPDTTRLSLLDLSADILHQILTLIQDGDPESVLDLALVCSSLYHQARYVQFRKFTLHLAEDASIGHSQLDYLQHYQALLPAIRTLYFVGTPSVRKKPREVMTQQERSRLDPDGLVNHLTPLLPMMTGLVDVHWHEGRESMICIPDELVTALKSRPHMRLHVSFQSVPMVSEPRRFPTHYVPQRHTMATLRGSPSLVSLSVEYTYNPNTQHVKFSAMAFSAAAKKLLLSCPNLRHLSVDMLPIARSRNYTGFGLSGQDDRPRTPGLETLTILNYAWGTNSSIIHQQQVPDLDWYGWRSADQGLLNYIGYPDDIRIPEPEYWATGAAFDWSRLVRLHELRPVLAYYLARLSPEQIPNLREVIFDYVANHPVFPHGGAAAARQFLLNIPTGQLEYISVSSLLWLGGDKVECITRHGETLRRLAMHNPEPGTDDPRWGLSAMAQRDREADLVPDTTRMRYYLSNQGWNIDGGFVNHSTLQVLRDSLPRLEELEIDMDRGGTSRDEWPWSMLSILATFPRLRSVKLWFARGSFPLREEDFQDAALVPRPYLTWQAASEMFRFLRERKNKAGEAVVGIQRLELCAGAPVATRGHEDQYVLENWCGMEDVRAYWAFKNSTRFVCELALRHEDGFTIRCPRLSNEENRKLERAARAETEYSWNPEKDGLDPRVALLGPVSLEEWKSKRFQTWLKKSEKVARTRKPTVVRLPWEKG